MFYFMCEDGVVRGAMRGCVQLFPQSETAVRTAKVVERVKRYDKKGWSPRREDSEVLSAIASRVDVSVLSGLLHKAELKAESAKWKMSHRGGRA